MDEEFLQEMVYEDLEPVFVPVKLKGKNYRLIEADTDAAVKYRNAVVRCAKLGPDGKPVLLDGAADSEPLLVQLCLREVVKERGVERLAPVSLGFVKSLAPNVTADLYARAKRISKLDIEEDTEETLTQQLENIQKRLDTLRASRDSEKNSYNGTTATSATDGNTENTYTR